MGVFVAIGALDVDMFSRQRHARFVVVELGLAPFFLGVAIGALGAQRSLVHVVLLVAGVAFQWRLAVFFRRFVALGACGGQVLAA